MCGILGFYDPTLSPLEGAQLLQNKIKIQHHRGPDSQGYWMESPVYLGHNRLAIFDLSELGAQPMLKDGISLVFNGEIYNYIEIRNKLLALNHTFKSDTDTEVIINAYKQWGTECVNEFRGMWAFALWDSNLQTLFCSRDRFGIKPFYYIRRGNRFYFASEIKTIKLSPIFKNDFNLKQVALSTQLGWSGYRSETHFTYINQLEAGHNLVLINEELKIDKYYSIKPVNNIPKDFEDRSTILKNQFFESIVLHMRSDVEVGACLSGGIDSSSIVSAIQSLFPKKTIKTFTIYYTGKDTVDERPFVNKVLAKYPSIQNYVYCPQSDDISDAYEKSTYFHDIPLLGSSYISQYFVMQLASKHKVKVLLDGQGADEYFAGYPHSFHRLLADHILKLNIIKYLKESYHNSKYKKHNLKDILLFQSKVILQLIYSNYELYNLEFNNYYPYPYLKKYKDPFELEENLENKLSNFLDNLISTTFLPSLLHYEDRNSSAFSLEARVPFLDHKLVELVFGFSNEDKIKNGYTKYILRHALQDILPIEIAKRVDKKGFVTPGEILWLRNELKWLLELPLRIDFIDKEIYKNEIALFKKGNNKNAKWIWNIVSLNYWITSL